MVKENTRVFKFEPKELTGGWNNLDRAAIYEVDSKIKEKQTMINKILENTSKHSSNVFDCLQAHPGVK